MSTISIATVFQEDVIKAFRPHLPKECVDLLVMLSQQNLMLEKALNEHHRVITSIVKTIDTFGNHHMQLQQQMEKIENKFSGSDLVGMENVNQ